MLSGTFLMLFSKSKCLNFCSDKGLASTWNIFRNSSWWPIYNLVSTGTDKTGGKVLETHYGGQFTTSLKLIKPNYPVIPLSNVAPQFLLELLPVIYLFKT